MSLKGNLDSKFLEQFERLSVKKKDKTKARLNGRKADMSKDKENSNNENANANGNGNGNGISRSRYIIKGAKIEDSQKEQKDDGLAMNEANTDPNRNGKMDIVFPWFDHVNYRHIYQEFEIEIPWQLTNWLKNLFTTILETRSFFDETDTLEWMVLLYPSLLLIVKNEDSKQEKEKEKCKDNEKKENDENECIVKLANQVIECMKNYVSDLFSSSESMTGIGMNNLLMCLELWEIDARYDFENSDILFSHFNDMFCEMDSINKFAKFCLPNKGYQNIIKFPKYKKTTLKNQGATVRETWTTTTALYTHLVRIHRIVYFDKVNNLNLLSKECIKNICKILYQFSTDYLPRIQEFWQAMIEMSKCVKMDYCFTRYKILCMSTHTPTTIAPTFAGYIGFVNNQSDITIGESHFIESNGDGHGNDNSKNENKSKQKEENEENEKKENKLNFKSFDLMHNALVQDCNSYFETICNVLNVEWDCENEKMVSVEKKELKNNKPKNQRNRNENVNYSKMIEKMKKRDREPLRQLDNIAYLSLCQLLILVSLPQSSEKDYYMKQIGSMRHKIRQFMILLCKHSLCFSKYIDRLSGNVFENSFLISEKHGRTQWVVHLMAATLLSLWRKSK